MVPAALWRLSQPKGGFALYRVSHHAYPPSVLPIGGVPRGSPEDALDTACGGCLGDPTAWIRPPKNYQREALVRSKAPVCEPVGQLS